MLLQLAQQLARVLALVPTYCNSFLSHVIGPLGFLTKRTWLGVHLIVCVGGHG